jgi:hypothetical protein
LPSARSRALGKSWNIKTGRAAQTTNRSPAPPTRPCRAAAPHRSDAAVAAGPWWWCCDNDNADEATAAAAVPTTAESGSFFADVVVDYSTYVIYDLMCSLSRIQYDELSAAQHMAPTQNNAY